METVHKMLKQGQDLFLFNKGIGIGVMYHKHGVVQIDIHNARQDSQAIKKNDEKGHFTFDYVVEEK